MKFSKLVAASLLAMASIPAAAQADDAPRVEIAVGAAVYGPDGQEVGKVTEVGDGFAVVDTGTNLATLSSDAFGKNADQKLLISMNKAQLDEAVAGAKQKAEAALATALVAGAAVHTSDGAQVGTVQTVNADNVVIEHQSAGAIALPKAQFTVDANGKLALGMTAAQLDAALAPQEQQAAAIDEALVAGAAVATSDGVAVGTVQDIQADGTVVVAREAGPIAFPKDQFTLTEDGGLSLRFTDAQLKAALSSS